MRSLLLGAASHSPIPTVAQLFVLVPELPPPYSQVFDQIIEGVRSSNPDSLQVIQVTTGKAPVGLAEATRPGNAVIALGYSALQAARDLGPKAQVVAGGVLSAPDALQSGISLEPDPALLYAELKTVKPRLRRVWVVYRPAHQEWLMTWARRAAQNAGIDLQTLPAETVKDASVAFNEIFSKADATRDALWLLQDPELLDPRSVLPQVLTQAWEHNLAVVSSSLDHVSRGALLALYPDNQRLGRRLGGLAQARAQGATATPGLMPLTDLRIAANRRTAAHLGVDLRQRRDGYDLLFPQR